MNVAVCGNLHRLHLPTVIHKTHGACCVATPRPPCRRYCGREVRHGKHHGLRDRGGTTVSRPLAQRPAEAGGAEGLPHQEGSGALPRAHRGLSVQRVLHRSGRGAHHSRRSRRRVAAEQEARAQSVVVQLAQHLVARVRPAALGRCAHRRHPGVARRTVDPGIVGGHGDDEAHEERKGRRPPALGKRRLSRTGCARRHPRHRCARRADSSQRRPRRAESPAEAVAEAAPLSDAL